MTVALNPRKPLGKRFSKRMEGIVWNFCKEGWVQCFFLGAKFCTLATKNKIKCQVYKGLLFRGEKKKAQMLPFFSKKTQKLSYFYNEFMEVTRTKQDSKIYILMSDL